MHIGACMAPECLLTSSTCKALHTVRFLFMRDWVNDILTMLGRVLRHPWGYVCVKYLSYPAMHC